ncbi:MAG: hypothetical protein JWM19_4898 [Actinomycetia bacterium]|nr:hypothetical protein [Actinomycetes bacterium]
MCKEFVPTVVSRTATYSDHVLIVEFVAQVLDDHLAQLAIQMLATDRGCEAESIDSDPLGLVRQGYPLWESPTEGHLQQEFGVVIADQVPIGAEVDICLGAAQT